METYMLMLSSFLIISCSRSVGTGNIIYDKATIAQLANKNTLKEQKLHEKAVKRKREELAIYQNNLPSKKQKKYSKN